MWSNKELKAKAWGILRTTYWKAFVACIALRIAAGITISQKTFNDTAITFSKRLHLSVDNFSDFLLTLFVLLIVFLVLRGIPFLFRVFIGYPLQTGASRYFLRASQGEADVKHNLSLFKKGTYMEVVKAMLWRELFLFLWTLAFIIPGIVKLYAYSMVPYILAENPNIGYRRALQLSNDMTYGYKKDIFVLYLSLFWIYIPSLLATVLLVFFKSPYWIAGITIYTLFVQPYFSQIDAELYKVLKKHALKKKYCAKGELPVQEEKLVHSSKNA